MKDIDRLIVRFRQFGGIRLVWQYAKMGVLWIGIREMVACAVKGKSLKAVYPVMTEKVNAILIRKYGGVGGQRQGDNSAVDDTKRGRIWVCWLQGMDNAPEMVKVCVESQRRIFGENNVVVLDDCNYTDWVQLPQYIVEKYHRGIIPGACFSDILRLELLIQYGGTWIDSSVLVTKPLECGTYRPAIKEIMDSELFIFRYFRRGKVVGMSNWLIHAKPQNPLLQDVRDMLYAYWRDYNCTVEYYIFHLFWGIVSKRYPEMMQRMPKGNSFHSIMLGGRLDKLYDEGWWQELTTHVVFHKMNYRQEDSARANPESYWNHILQHR